MPPSSGASSSTDEQAAHEERVLEDLGQRAAVGERGEPGVERAHDAPYSASSASDARQAVAPAPSAGVPGAPHGRGRCSVTWSATRRTCARSCDTISTPVPASRFSSTSTASSCRDRGLVEAARRLVEQQQLRRRIDGVGEQHALQLAAGERAERARSRSRRGRRAPAARRCAAACARADAEAHRPALARQGEELADGERQRAVDGEGLRHVADAAARRASGSGCCR